MAKNDNQQQERRNGGLNLPHHFDHVGQFTESGKLGMWLFLVTEIMMFGGLFCGYAIYRVRHPEIFHYAHKYLDPTLGGINTAVLIFSSLTMAWAVRAAMLGQKKLLVIMLSLTFLCACGFMGIKGVEYKEKWEHGLLWARQYNPRPESTASQCPRRPQTRSRSRPHRANPCPHRPAIP